MNPSEKSAQWIANAMKAAGISQAELARRMKVDYRWLSKILKGRRGMRVHTLLRILEACGFTDADLTGTRPKKAA